MAEHTLKNPLGNFYFCSHRKNIQERKIDRNDKKQISKQKRMEQRK